MLRNTLLIATLLSLFSCKQESNDFSKIKASQWLLGTWTQQSEQGILEETWTSANDSTLTGTSFFIKDKDTLHHETIVLQEKDNNLLYIATIKGENEDEAVTFPLTSSTDNTLIFENPKHDYPQKIMYSYNKNQLTATISGIQFGKQSTESFAMKKVK